MKTKSGALKSALKKNTMLIAFVIIVLMFEILTQGVLLVPQNVTNLIQQNSYVLILASPAATLTSASALMSRS